MGIKYEVKVVFLEVSFMHFILRISNEIKRKVKVVLLELSLINFILRISKEIKWKVKVVLLEVSLMNFIFWDIEGDQIEGESGVTGRIIGELHSWDIQGDKMERERMVLLEVSSMDLILGISN